MPNRIINEKIRTSKSINRLTDFQFRLWAYLLTYVDDYGRGSADPEILKGFVFPRRAIREQDIQKGLDALDRNGSILLYEVAGEPYFCLPGWAKYQRIQQKKAKFPDPPESANVQGSTVIHGESRCVTVSHRESPPESESESESNPNPREKNAHAARFSPPTVDAVAEYVREKGYHVNADRFVAFYQQKGWMIGKNHMKDWKAAVRTWHYRDNPKPPAEQKAPKWTYNSDTGGWTQEE